MSYQSVGRRQTLNSVAKVSIVVPVYGTESYLRKCLDSILSQTFTEIEVLCVDDCSPDRSSAIVEEYRDRDSRVRLIKHEKNLGLGGARNTGILHSSTKYVMGVDSDDYIHPRMVEDLYNCITSTNCDVAECGYVEVDESGKILSTYSPYRGVTQINNQTDIFGISRFAFWNKMFVRDLFVEHDIWFPNKLYYEDLATTPRIFCRAKHIGYVGDVRYYYVQRAGSITNAIKEKNLLDYIKVFDIIRQDLQHIGWYDAQRDNLNRTLQVNFDFIKKKIARSEDSFKMNLIRYADFIERAYTESVETDGPAVVPQNADATISIPAKVLSDYQVALSLEKQTDNSTVPATSVAILSKAGDDEAVTRLKIGALKQFLVGRVIFKKFEGANSLVDGLLINHLDAVEGTESDLRAFRKLQPEAPIIALVSDFYPRVAHQMKRFYDIIDAYAVPTDEMKNCMRCYTDALIFAVADPIDFQLTDSLRKTHIEKRPLDVVWFGYPESFEKSMLEYSPLLEYYHSIRKIRYHIVTDVSSFHAPEYALVHPYSSQSFVRLLPMFDICVASHAPNDFQLSTYVKSENKAVLAINRGVPVVASRTPSYERLLSNLKLDRFLFANRDELEAAISELQDPDVRNEYLSASQDFVLSKFSPDYIAEQWWSLFQYMRKSKTSS